MMARRTETTLPTSTITASMSISPSLFEMLHAFFGIVSHCLAAVFFLSPVLSPLFYLFVASYLLLFVERNKILRQKERVSWMPDKKNGTVT